MELRFDYKGREYVVMSLLEYDSECHYDMVMVMEIGACGKYMPIDYKYGYEFDNDDEIEACKGLIDNFYKKKLVVGQVVYSWDSDFIYRDKIVKIDNDNYYFSDGTWANESELFLSYEMLLGSILKWAKETLCFNEQQLFDIEYLNRDERFANGCYQELIYPSNIIGGR